MDIHVGIVAYRPQIDTLIHLVQTLAGYPVWLFLNSPLPDIRLPAAVKILNDGQNLGLGVAYNRIAAAARTDGAEMLLLLDQDSTPSADMASRLHETYENLLLWQEQPAVVGPLAVSTDGAYKRPRTFHDASRQTRDTASPTEFVISSGSLFNLAVLQTIGGFREDFFIDAIDIEWCFRARSLGYTCWIDGAVPMPHRLGQGVIRVPVLDMHLARQAPSRLYTYVRNQTAMLRLPHVPRPWKLRILPYMLGQSVIYTMVSRGNRRQVVRALGAGYLDGLRSRLGPGRRDSFQ